MKMDASTFKLALQHAESLATLENRDVSIWRLRNGKFTLSQPNEKPYPMPHYIVAKPTLEALSVHNVPHSPFGASHDALSAHTFYSTVFEKVCHTNTDYMEFAAAYADWYIRKIAESQR